MKVKIFESDDYNKIEREMNKFLSGNMNIAIKNILQSSHVLGNYGSKTIISIFYI